MVWKYKLIEILNWLFLAPYYCSFLLYLYIIYILTQNPALIERTKIAKAKTVSKTRLSKLINSKHSFPPVSGKLTMSTPDNNKSNVQLVL